MDVSLQGGDARAWAAYSEPTTFRLDHTLHEFGSEFLMRQTVDLEARLNLKLGASSAGNVWIGDVHLIDESAQPSGAVPCATGPQSSHGDDRVRSPPIRPPSERTCTH